MVKIELGNGYFIEQNELNNTLKKRYLAEKKDGTKYLKEKPCGYYNSSDNGFEGAVSKYLKLNQIDLTADLSVEMGEYVKLVKQINDDAVQAVKRAAEGSVNVEKIAERLVNASYHTISTFDEDGYSNDDSQEVVDLDKAIEIVRTCGGNDAESIQHK